MKRTTMYASSEVLAMLDSFGKRQRKIMASSMTMLLFPMMLIFLSNCAPAGAGVQQIGSSAEKPVANFVYVLTKNNKLKIYDVSNPYRPVVVSSIKSKKGVSNISVSSNIAFLSKAESEVILYDVSGAGKPLLLSRINTRALATKADQSRQLVLNLLSRSDAQREGSDVIYYQDFLYIADEVKGLIIVDCHNPAQPKVIASLVEAEGMIPAWDFKPLAKNRGPSIQFPEHLQFGGGGLSLIDSTLLLHSILGQICVISLEDPGKPIIELSLATIGTVRDLDIKTNALVTLEGERGFSLKPNAPKARQTGNLVVYNFTDKNLPLPGGVLELSGPLKTVKIQNSLAYVAAGESGIHIVDIGNLSQPLLLNTISLSGSTEDISLKQNYLFAVNATQGLQVLDISDPWKPKQIGKSQQKFPAAKIAISK